MHQPRLLAARPPAGEAATHRTPVLVIGVGNYLMGDEGVGIHVLRALQELPPLDGVELIDGGTGGVNLLPELERADRVIMIDATRDGRPAGSITRLEPSCPAEVPRGLSAHDFGVKDLFAAAALLGHFPAITLFTISVETVRPMSIELSLPVAAAVAPVVREVWPLASQWTEARQEPAIRFALCP